MPVALGVDLGTSNTMAAYSTDGKASQLIVPSEAGYLGVTHASAFPSYVEFDTEGNLDSAGARAKAKFDQQHGGTVFRHLKRLIGQPYEAVSKGFASGAEDRFLREFKGRIDRTERGGIALIVPTSDGASKTCPVEVAVAHLLSLVWEDAKKQVAKSSQEITHVAVTVPAIFSDGQREATMQAAGEVFKGVNLMKPIEEPVAAALAYGIENEATVMVIDIGAGTTDITVGQLSWIDNEPRFQVVYLGGDPNLGGLDMDFAILEHLCNIDENEPKLKDVLAVLSLRTLGALMSQIEQVKIAASLSPSRRASIATTIAFEYQGEKFLKVVNHEFSIEELEQACRPIIDKCVQEVRKCLTAMAGSDKQDDILKTILSIDAVVPVGGPMGFGPLREALARVFDTHPYAPRLLRELNPREDFRHQEAVARGAAMAAARLARPARAKKSPFSGVVPYDISLFFLRTGGSVVVPQQYPYEEKAEVSMPFHFDSGPSRVMVLSHVGDSLADATFRCHTISVPSPRQLSLQFEWSTSGLQVHIPDLDLHFPSIEEHGTFGHYLNEHWEGFAKAVREAPKIADELPDQLYDHVALRLGAPRELVEKFWGEISSVIPQLGDDMNFVRQMRTQHQDELQDATNIQWPQPPLTEEELRAIFELGYFGYRRDLALSRGVTPRVYRLMQVYFDTLPGYPLSVLTEFLLQQYGSVGVSATSRVRSALASYKLNPNNASADASLRLALAQFISELAACGAITADGHTRLQNAIAYAYNG